MRNQFLANVVFIWIFHEERFSTCFFWISLVNLSRLHTRALCAHIYVSEMAHWRIYVLRKKTYTRNKGRTRQRIESRKTDILYNDAKGKCVCETCKCKNMLIWDEFYSVFFSDDTMKMIYTTKKPYPSILYTVMQNSIWSMHHRTCEMCRLKF